MKNKLDPIGVLSESIIKYIKEALQNASFDKTQKGIITETLSGNHYKVKIAQTTYTVPAVISGSYSVGDEVYIIIPQNDPDQMFLLPVGISELDPSTTVLSVNGKTGYVSLEIEDIPSLSSELNSRVLKEAGKGLSSNDYTTAEKQKLAGISQNANHYVHPTSSGNKHIPEGGQAGQILRWEADGTAQWDAEKDAYTKKESRQVFANAFVGEKSGEITALPDVSENTVFHRAAVQGVTTEVLPNPEADKSPDNIAAISGAEPTTLTTCGKNLISFTPATTTRNGLTCVRKADGTITLDGTWEDDDLGYNGTDFTIMVFAKLKPGTYFLSGGPAGGSVNTYNITLRLDNPNANYRYFQDYGAGCLATIHEGDTTQIWVRVIDQIGTVHLTFRPQLEVATSATPFEPYTGTAYTLPAMEPLMSLPNGVCDEYDLVSGVETRRIGKLTLNGTEEWDILPITSGAAQGKNRLYTNKYNWDVAGALTNRIKPNLNCTHYPAQSGDNLYLGQRGITITKYTDTRDVIYLFDEDYQTAENWTSYLTAQSEAGTPVTVYYELKTPVTIQHDPEEIPVLAPTTTVFADAGMVSVSYNRDGNQIFDEVCDSLSGKVDKVSGKGLSTNDYTTAEKQKLAGIQANANYYVHPETHLASMIQLDDGTSLQSMLDEAILVSDWNDAVKPGMYFSQSNADNKPPSLVNDDWFGQVFSYGDRIKQILTHASSAPIGIERWVRSWWASSQSWSAWSQSFKDATPSTGGLMSSTDKAKLDGIEANANNYTHPSTHPASMIQFSNGKDLQTIFDESTLITDWNLATTSGSYYSLDFDDLNHPPMGDSIYSGYVSTFPGYVRQTVCGLITNHYMTRFKNTEVGYWSNWEDVSENQAYGISFTPSSDLVSTSVQSAINEVNNKKVDKEEGKGLSANDYTDDEKAKLQNTYNKEESRQAFANAFVGEKSGEIAALADVSENTVFRRAAVQGVTTEVLPNPEEDKSPDNIATISGAEPTKLTACGKNLFDMDNCFPGEIREGFGITFTKTPDGILANGTATSQYYTIPYNMVEILKVGKTYTVSTNDERAVPTIQVKSSTGETYKKTYTVAGDETSISVYFYFSAGVTVENLLIKFQLEEGPTATAYEPYTGTAYTLPAMEPLMSLPNGVCDEYDLVSGVEVRRIGKLTLNGTENWEKRDADTVNAYSWNLYLSDVSIGVAPDNGHESICSHYKFFAYCYANEGQEAVNSHSFTSNGYEIYFNVSVETVEEWKSYLAAQDMAGTPVTVYYELKTPVTTQHDPEEIPVLAPTTTVFADAGKVSVSYNRDSNQIFDEVCDSLSGKVDKVSGKVLSSNDYTTAEKQKLAGIQANANNYTHPSTHPASMIVFTDGDTFQQKLDQGELKGEKGDTGEIGPQGPKGDSFKVGESYETAVEKTIFFKLML